MRSVKRNSPGRHSLALHLPKTHYLQWISGIAAKGEECPNLPTSPPPAKNLPKIRKREAKLGKEGKNQGKIAKKRKNQEEKAKIRKVLSLCYSLSDRKGWLCYCNECATWISQMTEETLPGSAPSMVFQLGPILTKFDKIGALGSAPTSLA